MPIYEYACNKCGYKFEEMQKLSDKPLTLCPKCNKKDLKKLMSAAGVHIKNERICPKSGKKPCEGCHA